MLPLSLWENADAARTGMFIGFDYANFLKVSEEEVEFLTGGSDVALLWRDNIKLIAVTRGEKGSTIYTPDTHYDVAGFGVNSVDTTGAGDSFVAAMLVSILENPDYMANLPQIARFANAVGALTTMQKGAIPSLPTRAAAEQFAKALI